MEDEQSRQTLYLVTEQFLADRFIDWDAVKGAILARRDQSQRLNEDWDHVDQETWDRSADV